MIVYLVRASEWESDIDCVCATKEIADRERRRLANEYGLDDDEMVDFIDCISMNLIEE